MCLSVLSLLVVGPRCSHIAPRRSFRDFFTKSFMFNLWDWFWVRDARLGDPVPQCFELQEPSDLSLAFTGPGLELLELLIDRERAPSSLRLLGERSLCFFILGKVGSFHASSLSLRVSFALVRRRTIVG